MGLIEALDYKVKPVNQAQRMVQKVAATKPVAWGFSKTLHYADRGLSKITKGKFTVPGLTAGLPVIMVTTTGAKSGEARTMPLLGIPVGEDIAIIGTNFGQAPTPGWVYNLEADPNGSVLYRDSEADFVARRATAEEATAVLSDAGEVYPGYNSYQERISDREIRIFVLQLPAVTAED